MAPRSTIFKAEEIVFGFWLVFDRSGQIRLARTEPSLDRDERSMYCEVTLPRALWRTPQLRATISIADPGPESRKIDIAAAGDALRGALGCDVDFRIMPVDVEDKTS